MFKANRKKVELSTKLASLIMLGLMAFLLLGIIVLQFDLHVLLLLATALLVIISMFLGYSFSELMEFMKDSLLQCIPVLMIFILIGAVIASWIFSGTVPGVIYYGLKYMRADLFLPLGLIILTVVSMAIGTAWGTAATIGIALMGIGHTLGIPDPVTAGMVISGSFFGDKMTPISDTAALASASSGGDIYKHLKAMFTTAGPSFLISLVIFYFMNQHYVSGTIDQVELNNILHTLEANFSQSLLVFLPILLLFFMNIKEVPAVPSMIIGITLASVLGIFLQGVDLKTVFDSINYGYDKKTGHELLDSLLNRGGIQSMMWTFSLAFIAVAFGGILDKIGYLKQIISSIIKKVNKPGPLAILVMTTTTLGTVAMGEIYLSLIVNGNLYREEFKNKGYQPELLSRFLEEGGTLTQVFIPWSTSGAFMATTLGVSTFAYAPYAILNYINGLVSILFCYLGIFVLRRDPKEMLDQIQKKKGKKNGKNTSN